MITIFISVFFNSILLVILKLFAKYEINTLHALVANYFTAFTVGLIVNQTGFSPSEFIAQPWSIGCFVIGFLFITVFFATAKTAQANGIGVASIASKMSLIIPILSGVVIFNEVLNLYKIIGIILALVAVFFATKKEGMTINKDYFLYPILVFIGAGIIDASLNYFQVKLIPSEDTGIFSLSSFLMAFFAGILIITIKTFTQPEKILGKSILGGIVLGIPNYFSLYYLIKMLEHPTLNSSAIFTIHNVSIVIFTTLIGVLFMKESLSKKNILGLFLAILAIIIVSL